MLLSMNSPITQGVNATAQVSQWDVLTSVNMSEGNPLFIGIAKVCLQDFARPWDCILQDLARMLEQYARLFLIVCAKFAPASTDLFRNHL